MVHSFGYRARTRDLFSRGFRKNGTNHLSTYMNVYHLGDLVDVVVNPSIHKGMPFKHYHGRTGRVWNVTKRAIGVEFLKQVGHRYMKKRIHVRVEHVRPSNCQKDFKERVKANQAAQAEYKKTGVKVCLKRQPAGPKPKEHVKCTEIEELKPELYAGLQ
eukprot:gnl/Trimastix_PCT/43.p3 GENE.gnl/Trimastix_PCT/43~~gnl/Trimastix_PCT/43.p3  ORF type:complete len:159 (+),score=55.80 gnl/Trimastix_PCT/43:709-1185(+)